MYRICWILCFLPLLLFFHYFYWQPSKNFESVVMISTVQYKVVEIKKSNTIFKLATIDGHPPYADGDRAQETILESLQLSVRCKHDSSLVVVDVGAFLGNYHRSIFLIFIIIPFIGEFGLYAATCGCRVYFFEVQPDMVALIQKSIQLNQLPTSRVQVFHRAISDLPSHSELTFSIQAGTTTVSNGTLKVKTIRLDDVPWPPQSTILMLKIDVEGFELNAIRSAINLFKQNRIHHLIFEYTAWWTDRSSQTELIPYVEKILRAKKMYALGRLGTEVYGPLTREILDRFHNDHAVRHLQTDIYATFVSSDKNSSLKVQPYVLYQSFA